MNPNDELVEKVAKAIYESASKEKPYLYEPWIELIEIPKAFYFSLARAAIAAMPDNGALVEALESMLQAVSNLKVDEDSNIGMASVKSQNALSTHKKEGV